MESDLAFEAPVIVLCDVHVPSGNASAERPVHGSMRVLQGLSHDVLTAYRLVEDDVCASIRQFNDGTTAATAGAALWRFQLRGAWGIELLGAWTECFSSVPGGAGSSIAAIKTALPA